MTDSRGGRRMADMNIKMPAKWACGLAFLACLAGCSSSTVQETAPHLSLSCVDDSAHCIKQREKAFDQLMADKSRAWVKQPATPEAYASGVRLFALNKKRKELSCDELAAGKREADAGPGVLRGNSGGRLTPAQVSRGVMLAAEVGRDLGSEMAKRCRKT
jgi:hypothetical protein